MRYMRVGPAGAERPIARGYVTRAERSKERFLNDVVGVLGVRCEPSREARELSREARVHPVHLSRVFRRFQRQGIGEYIRRLRARTASTLLLNPEIPLADISFATGFADQSHFTRAFRKVTGMTPQAFRAALHPA